MLNHASGEDGTWSHGSVAARPPKWLRETQGHSPFPRVRSLCTIHVLSAGRLQQCTYLPVPNHVSGEDGTWSPESVASRPIKWQQETSGRSPFQHAQLLCKMHVRRGSNSQIRVVMLEDLVVLYNQFIYVSLSIRMFCKLQQN